MTAMLTTPLADLHLVAGDLASGHCTIRLSPRSERLWCLVSGRAMGNLRALIPWGEKAESHVFLALVGPAGAILLAVDPPLDDQAVFRVEDGLLTIAAPAPITLAWSAEGICGLLAAYARRWPETRPGPALVGWNSWDCLGAAVDQEAVLALLAAIDDDPLLAHALTHVIIDDGWQTSWGDWRANGKFPDGMRCLADAIHAQGRRAGLWLAPLIAEPRSQLYHLHPGCFLSDDHGHPFLCEQGLGMSYYALDVSVEATRAFLHRTFAAVKAWGYDYVKLDFLVSHAEVISLHGARSPSGWSSNRHIAEMLAIARQELGPVHINACNHPFELGGGAIDEVRLGSDIGPFWENFLFAYNAWVARFFLAGRAFLADPDFALVRVPAATWRAGAIPFHWTPAWQRNQAPGGWRRGPFWTLEEMRMSLALVMMSGGSVVLGDWLPQLEAEGRRHIAILLALAGGTPAVPLDLDGSRPLPCLFSNNRALFAFNPFATPVELVLPATARLGPEAFTGAAPEAVLTLAAHTCRVHPFLDG